MLVGIETAVAYKIHEAGLAKLQIKPPYVSYVRNLAIIDAPANSLTTSAIGLKSVNYIQKPRTLLTRCGDRPIRIDEDGLHQVETALNQLTLQPESPTYRFTSLESAY